MTVLEFLQTYWSQGLLYLIIGAGVIEITPIKINPFSWIARKIGRALNEEVIEKVDAVDKRVDAVNQKLEEHIDLEAHKNADNIRKRILSFTDDLLQGKKSTKEHFEEILSDIDEYEKYCLDKPEYPNNKCAIAIEVIKAKYGECLKDNTFLQDK